MRKKGILFLVVISMIGGGCVLSLMQLVEGEVPEKEVRLGLVKIRRVAICRSVEGREPVGIATEFPADIGKVWCFTEAVDVGPETTITHVWYHGNVQRAAVELKVRGARWRTYSSKNIRITQTGPWRVDILDARGNLIESIDFTIKNP